jgi:hypothetical protein
MYKVYKDITKSKLLVNTKTKAYKDAIMEDIETMLKDALIAENEFIAAYHVYAESPYKKGINGYCIWVFNKSNLDDQLVFVDSPESVDDNSIVLNNKIIGVNGNVFYITLDNIWEQIAK